MQVSEWRGTREGACPSNNTILLIEDDEQISGSLTRILDEEGFDVIVAADGRIGLELARELRPDLVLLDLVLPGLNGFDTAMLLKEDETTASIPIIAVTASWLGSDSGRLREIGFDGALRKPFAADALIAELDRVLDPYSRTDSATFASA